nr:hypothetical protein BEI47_17635 [Aliivibrio fischeri]
MILKIIGCFVTKMWQITSMIDNVAHNSSKDLIFFRRILRFLDLNDWRVVLPEECHGCKLNVLELMHV